MPELPEVEVVRRGLSDILEDQPKIKKIELMRADLRELMPAKEIKKFEGQRVYAIQRRAKYLLFECDKGFLLSHLGMTGTWRVAPAGQERNHDHIYMTFENGIRLAYRDPRRFGYFDVVHDVQSHPKLSHLGVEPLSESFTGKALLDSLKNKTIAIKVAIMDQKIVVGVGNIYASEALFASGIKPQMPANKVSLEKCKKLVSEIRKVLKSSIEKGGSSISDFAQTNGSSGYFQNTFKVYAREGESCLVCAAKIRSEVLGGRNTFWCSKCQK